MTDKREGGQNWQATLTSELARLPDDYTTAYQQITQIRHDFLAAIAAAIEPRINSLVAQLPQHSMQDKQAIASLVNNDLRALNLGLRSPTTGTPAILIADFRDREENSSRFRLQVVDPSGRVLRKDASAHAPHLLVQEAPLREEKFARRREPSDHLTGPVTGPAR